MANSWDSLHPLVVHFPVALLLTAPVFVLAALLVPDHSRWFLISSLILMLIGTGGVYVGVSTGEAAFVEAETPGPEADAILDQHQEWGEMLRPVYTGLTAVLAVIIGLWPRITHVSRWAGPAVLVLFLLALGAGGYVLVRTAHLGGRLVHEYGVHAVLGAEED